MASIRMKLSSSTSPIQKNFYPWDLKNYREGNPQLTNQDHLTFHHLFNLLANHSKPAQSSVKGSTAYLKE
jgi:hypothetical protein